MSDTESADRELTPLTPHKRIILKNGDCNISQPPSRRQLFDFFNFHRLVDFSWLTTLYVFTLTLLTSWFIFGVFYWLICNAHGDFELNHLPEMQEKNNFTPCIYQMYNFESCFLFSIESQHTVGYGIKATTEECSEAIFVNIIQCIMGFIMQGLMSVIILTKMTLPSHRTKTILFSKQATISTIDNIKYFMFRIGDIRKNHISHPKCRAYIIITQTTHEGESIQNQEELKLESDNCHKRFFFNWPLVMKHKIDQKSPLCNFLNCDSTYEIVVVLEGNVDSTGQTIQGRMSYILDDIVFEKKFDDIMTVDYYRNEYNIDFSRFHNLLAIINEEKT